MSSLVLAEILGVFVNTLTADATILFQIARISNSQFKCNYLKNDKLFLNFLFPLSNLHQILNFLKKRMIVTAKFISEITDSENLS